MEFAAVAAISILYTSSRFQEKILELKLSLDKELAPLYRQQSEIEGELRRLDAIIRSEDIINVSDQKNSTLLTVMIAMWILKSKD